MALSNLAEELLSAAAESKLGTIFVSRDATYQTVLVGTKDFVKSPGQVAEAKAAVNELKEMGYVTAMIDSFLFSVTSSGRQAADHS